MEKTFALEHSPKQPLYSGLLHYPSVDFDDFITIENQYLYYYLRVLGDPYDYIVKAVYYNYSVQFTLEYRRRRVLDADWENIPYSKQKTYIIDIDRMDTGIVKFYKYKNMAFHMAAPAARILRRKSRRSKRACRVKRRKTVRRK